MIESVAVVVLTLLSITPAVAACYLLTTYNHTQDTTAVYHIRPKSWLLAVWRVSELMAAVSTIAAAVGLITFGTMFLELTPDSATRREFLVGLGLGGIFASGTWWLTSVGRVINVISVQVTTEGLRTWGYLIPWSSIKAWDVQRSVLGGGFSLHFKRKSELFPKLFGLSSHLSGTVYHIEEEAIGKLSSIVEKHNINRLS